MNLLIFLQHGKACRAAHGLKHGVINAIFIRELPEESHIAGAGRLRPKPDLNIAPCCNSVGPFST